MDSRSIGLGIVSVGPGTSCKQKRQQLSHRAATLARALLVIEDDTLNHRSVHTLT